MSELDKRKKSLSRQTAGIRGWIQAAATLLTNIHIPNFFKGKIYQGNAKTVCVPGLNCYSCPAATGACPIGAFQAVIGSSRFKCSRVCKMDVDVCKHPDHPECIQCGACIKACPKDAIHYRFMGK